MKKAVVLLSGGMDSATTLYWAKKKGYEAHCLIFEYGQRHKRELESAKALAKSSRCKYTILKISLPWKGSALLNKKQALPKNRNLARISKEIPPTYVPARNTIFLSFALSCAEALGADAIFIGANARDYSGYPDCRPEFFKSFETLIRKGTKVGIEGKRIKISAPLLYKTKDEIIRLGTGLGVPFELTWSCYRGEKKPCFVCDSCRLREMGFKKARIADPLLRNSQTRIGDSPMRVWESH